MSQLNSTTELDLDYLNVYGSDGFDTIEESGVYDYSWHEIALVRWEATGQLYFGENSGCSCSCFWDGPTLTPVASWQEWAKLAQEWADAKSDGWGCADEKKGAIEAIERLNRSRPAPSPK